MSILGCFMFKMMKNNNEMAALYKFDKDIYDFHKDEEEILNEFMKELNKNRADKLSNQKEEKNGESINKEDIFPESFENKIEDSSLEYEKNNDKIFLITNKDNQINRKREITYIFRDEKIILVPTYKFEDNVY